MGEILVKQEILDAVEVYVKDHLPQFLFEAGIINRDLYTYYLLDKKIVQLEESIKNQFYNLERRIQQIDEKIDQKDLRYEALEKQVNK